MSPDRQHITGPCPHVTGGARCTVCALVVRIGHPDLGTTRGVAAYHRALDEAKAIADQLDPPQEPRP